MIVICNGMLRSGSTLQYNIAAMVLETKYNLERVGFLGHLIRPKERARLEWLRQSNRWAIVKTHDPPLPQDFYTDRVHVLFSYRDVRDIAASIKKKWAYPFEQILSDLDATIAIENSFVDIPGVLVQPYDLLFADIASAARQIAHQLGVALADERVFTIADFLTAGSRQDDISGSGYILRRLASRIINRTNYDPETLLHSDHISASCGNDGDWANQFSASEIDVLNDRYAGWLASHGYPMP
ncbi:MAG: hypothetical protein IPM60_05735 [Rhodospirillales bacterium]|nr:hypothetical protein [Rhodospirillales bacterium]